MKTVRWSLMALLAAWGMLSLLVLAGEENPVEPVALARFVAVKAAAALSLLLCCLTTGVCDRRGLLPRNGADDSFNNRYEQED